MPVRAYKCDTPIIGSTPDGSAAVTIVGLLGLRPAGNQAGRNAEPCNFVILLIPLSKFFALARNRTQLSTIYSVI